MSRIRYVTPIEIVDEEKLIPSLSKLTQSNS